MLCSSKHAKKSDELNIMKIYFKDKILTDSPAFGEATIIATQLILLSVNYKPRDEDFIVEVPDNEFKSMSGRDVVETLERLNIVQEQVVQGRNILVQDETFDSYKIDRVVETNNESDMKTHFHRDLSIDPHVLFRIFLWVIDIFSWYNLVHAFSIYWEDPYYNPYAVGLSTVGIPMVLTIYLLNSKKHK